MKKILKRFPQAILLLILFFAVACQEKEAMKFDSENAVYFYNLDQIYNYYVADSMIYSFMDHGAVTKDTVEINVKLIGKASDQDRTVNVVVDSTNATESVDFDIIRPIIMEKDSIHASMKVVLHRTATLQTEAKTIWFSLQSSDDFTVDESSYPNLTFWLRFSDKIERPSWWDMYFYAYQYSETRMRFYIEVIGSTKEPSPSLNAVIYLLKSALAEYNATHAEPLSDEYGPLYW